jgi:hypothetical protein
MLRNLCRKLLAAAAVFVLVAGLAPAGVFAQENTVTAVVEVGPGERRCLDNPTLANNRAAISDSVINGPAVKFIFLGRPANGGFWEISKSGPVLAYSDFTNAPPSPPPASFIPPLFPGFFRTCARNDAAEPATVYLSVTVN